MKRLASLTFAALALSVLIAAPGQTKPTRFFFEQGHAAVAFWQSSTATEQTTTVVTFFAADRGSVPGERTTTFLSYFSETQTWDGSQWLPASTVSALAHSDNGDLITYEIGPGGRSITASATAQAQQCIPSFPNCTPAGTVQLDASWLATGEGGRPEDSPGHHITDWNGSGCDIDFRSGRTLTLDASATAKVDGVPPAGDFLFAQIESFQGVEVMFCK